MYTRVYRNFLKSLLMDRSVCLGLHMKAQVKKTLCDIGLKIGIFQFLKMDLIHHIQAQKIRVLAIYSISTNVLRHIKLKRNALQRMHAKKHIKKIVLLCVKTKGPFAFPARHLQLILIIIIIAKCFENVLKKISCSCLAGKVMGPLLF